MTYPWLKWLKNWRTIADTSSPTTYIPIVTTVDGTVFEVLRVSKFQQDHDGNKAHIETTIREFNDKTALHSKATRDLGIVLVISNNRKPTFVIEPGADVLEWRASTHGVSAKKLLEVMREGEIGRRVRRKDRNALKNSREQQAAAIEELNDELAETRAHEKKLLAQLAEIELELDSAKKDRDRMRETVIRQNEKHGSKNIPADSGTEKCTLGPLTKGDVPKHIVNLPGHFNG